LLISSFQTKPVRGSAFSDQTKNFRVLFPILKYRVSVKSSPDYKHLLKENYVEYKHIFFFQNVTQEVFLQHTQAMVKKMFVFHVVIL